ncbi:MAG: CoA transferase [Desulfobacteraceae bacterium]|nr:MAG: CoA transferase [Desulfobacteraceae bacterium]
MEVRHQHDPLLEGIRILDLTDEKASFCSKLLADLGACVIKVERPGGDLSRRIGPFLGNDPHPERSLYFFNHNSNKLGVTLNLEHPEGREIFSRLVEKADVVVESFPPGYLGELGLGFEVLNGTNPKLILISVTGFGQNGPRSRFKSSDIVASAFGGQMYVSGFASTPPLKPFGEQSCYAASLFGAIGVLLALKKRIRTGKGEHVDISMQESVVSTLEHVWVRYFYEGIIAKRLGGMHWNNNFLIFRCKDGHILISLLQQWDTLVEWMASEEMAEDLMDDRWKDEKYRQRNLYHVIEVIQRWASNHTAEELFEQGQRMRFPWAPVCSPMKVTECPQLSSRGFFIEVDHPEISGSIPYPGTPYKFEHGSMDRWRRAPLVGEDNVTIFQKELGLSDEELKRLSAIHVI